MFKALLLILCLTLQGCSAFSPYTAISKTSYETIIVPAASYSLGSDTRERNWAYNNSPSIVFKQQWYDRWELPPYYRQLDEFRIDRTPVSQRQYVDFIKSTGHRVPTISATSYQQQGYLLHPYKVVKEYLWQKNAPPSNLMQHPVVLVNYDDAKAYCRWKGQRLPQESEWEAACRSEKNYRFPWGNLWSSKHLQHQEKSTAAIGSYPAGATASGIEDMLGNTFEWTSSDFEKDQNNKVLKSCSWDDAPGTCRCGFRHGRSAQAKHILIGFRCVSEPLD